MIQISSDKNGTSLMIGIIYKYTSPVGKIYIGQTTEERRRRKTFLNLNKTYGGIKIDRAREKYGPEKFSYEVLEKLRFKIVSNWFYPANNINFHAHLPNVLSLLSSSYTRPQS